MADKVEKILKALQLYEEMNVDELWNDIDLTNVIFKNINVLKVFINYITSLHKTEYIDEVLDYAYKLKDKDLNKIIDNYYFYEGKYTKIKLDNIDEKMLNEILIFNKQPTKDEHFNDLFNQIKDYNISEYTPIFDKIYLNARHNDLKFNFLKNKYSTKVPTLIKHFEPYKVKYDYTFSDSFIMKYNHDNECFKRAFFALCSLHLDKSFNHLLNTFINFESLFYSKIVQINNDSTNLITYLYFKSNENYVPNIRYTLDICGKDTQAKIEHLRNVPPRIMPGFKTSIISDDKGIYFSTSEYNIDKIIEHAEELIKNEKYDELLYYIFNAQFLSRSTCLFGYYLYFKLTNKIPNEIKYYDIIALTEDFNTFKESLNFKEYFITETKTLTLSQIIDFVLSE